MARKFSLVLCTCVFFLPLILTGCGGSSHDPMSSGSTAQGAPPSVSAVATQVNGVAG